MEAVVKILQNVLILLVALVVLGVGTERGTELVKVFLREVAARVPWLNFKGNRAFLLAAVVAFCVTYFFKVDLTQYLPLLDGFDPRLVELVTALLTLLFSNKIHDQLKAG